MQKRNGAFGFLVAALLLPMATLAEQPPCWQPTLESAKRLAGQSNRLVLVFFWADWCSACRKMEHEVLDQPGVISRLQAHYVPVKINADHFPATARQYGVTALPTTIVLTPAGQPLEKLQGRAETSAYLAKLNRVANSTGRRPTSSYAQIPSAASPPAIGHVNRPPTSPNYQPSAPSRNTASQTTPQTGAEPVKPQASMGARYANPAASNRDIVSNGGYGTPNDRYGTPTSTSSPQASDYQPGSTDPMARTQAAAPTWQPPVTAAQPVAGPPSSYGQPSPAGQPSAAGQPLAVGQPRIEIPPGNPPLGLDGYCPVSLADNSETWVLGDRRYGAIHQGRTYLFAGPEQQRRFLSNPDRFAPVFSGNDVVMAVDTSQTTPGKREHGLFFGSKVYLFSSEQTLAKFSSDPNRYADGLLQLMHGGASTADRRTQASSHVQGNRLAPYGGYPGPAAPNAAARYQ